MSITLTNADGSVNLVFDAGNENVLILSCFDKETKRNHEVSHVPFDGGRNYVGTAYPCPECEVLAMVIKQERMYGINEKESIGIAQNPQAWFRFQKAKDRLQDIRDRKHKMLERMKQKEHPNRAMKRAKTGGKLKWKFVEKVSAKEDDKK